MHHRLDSARKIINFGSWLRVVSSRVLVMLREWSYVTDRGIKIFRASVRLRAENDALLIL